MSSPLLVAQGWMVSTPDPDGQSHRVRLPPGWRLKELALRAAGIGAQVVYVWDEVGSRLPLRTPAARWIREAAADGYTAEVTGGHLEEGPVWRWRLAPIGNGAIACAPGGRSTRLGHAPVSIVLLPNDESGMAGPWFGLDARDTLNAFAAFQRLVGVAWGDSTGHTAEALILSTHPRRKGGTLLDVDEIPEPVRTSSLELPWAAWQRPRSVEEAAAPFVHSFDGNAQYLAAWGTVEVGHGHPMHLTGSPRFDPGVAGFWRIGAAVTDKLRNVRPELPTPWLAGQEWYSTPTMIRTLEVCDGLVVPEPVEAWVWPKRTRFFRAAAERLRDARAAAMAAVAAADLELGATVNQEQVEAALRKVVAAGAVLDAVKDMYRVQTGRFNMHRNPKSGWARPDWGHTIRAQARANLHRRLWRLSAAPFAIATDGLLFTSDTKDAAAFAERIGLPLGTGLGQFRHVATASAEVLPVEARVSKLFLAVANG